MKTNNWYGDIEYIMSRPEAKALLSTRKPGEMSINPHKWLIDYVNNTFMLKGNCVKVTIVD